MAEPRPPGLRAFELRGDSPDGPGVIGWDRSRLRAAAARGGPLRIDAFPLADGQAVDLEVEPFAITSPGTSFVLGRRGAPDRSLAFDTRRTLFLRGHVVGRPGSHVFLAFGGSGAMGSIDLVPGEPGWLISSRGARGLPLGPGRLAVFRAAGPAAGSAAPRACEALQASGGAAATVAPQAAATVLARTRRIRVAVDTDHEYFALFADAEAAAEYLVLLYGRVADIYLRDLNARVELTFVRLWDQPDDLFNDVDPTPLFDFREHWIAFMGHVGRDAAQLLSGRRDYPFGGQAFLRAMCTSSAYSVVGYVLGAFPDPARPSPYHYDIGVVAHELGHNAGTGHTHDAPNFVDRCHDPASQPQRGSIMSYCSQTWSGQNANEDLYFHTRIRQNIVAHLAAVSCLADDCNGNGVADALDVQQATSADTDANGVPDECEDCDRNGTPDGVDIVAGGAADVDLDGVPDGCEPDCDGDGTPDDHEIALGLALDAHGNGVPDACETDCDGDGVADYSEIQADMTLDADRDARLDACQDCDADGTPDLEALDGAHAVWVASGAPGSPVREFLGPAGTPRRVSTGALVEAGQDLIVSPRGTLWVSSAADHRVVEFSRDGTWLGDLVPSGAGGLVAPAGLALTADGRLLVASSGTNSVLAFDAVSGVPLGAFVEAAAGGLVEPFGLVFGPQGNLFVGAATGAVLEFDGTSGAFVRVFVSPESNGGLSEPRGMAFKPDGNLLVASFGTNAVLEFDGASGAPLGRWAQAGTPTSLNQVSPWGVRVGPNGNVFVARTGDAFGSGAPGGHDHDGADDHDEGDTVGGRTVSIRSATQALHLTNAQIYEFDARTGGFIRAFVGGNDHGLSFPTGFDFVPGWDRDCDVNQLPDTCDVSGPGIDADSSGVPDSCEADCNGNGAPDRLELIPYGTSRDCDANLRPDECDLAGDPLRDCDANGVLDDCEPAAPGVAQALHPAEVEALRVAPAAGSPATVRLAWTDIGAALRYDVAGGALSTLHGAEPAECLAAGLTTAEWVDTRGAPAPGEGAYYLVRARSRCAAGSWGRSSAGSERSAVDCP